MSFMKVYQEKKAAVEEHLARIFSEFSEIPAPLRDAMAYSFLDGGKRLRPILLLESYRMFGKEPTESVVRMAAAIEAIHCYSLIHDDLPAMDNDDTRRGKPTCHKVYGDGIAVLAGDALLNLAHELMLDACLENLGNERFLKAAALISKNAGARGMIAGQAVDITANDKISIDTLKYIFFHKTGDLMVAAAVSGALLGGASPEELAHMRSFAQHFAYAFQIKDDLIDYEEKGESDEVSFVKFYGRGRSSQTLGDSTQKAQKELIALMGRDTGFLKQLTIKFAARKE